MKITLDNLNIGELLDLARRANEMAGEFLTQRGPWVPKPGDIYWFIFNDGHISSACNNKNEYDHYRIQRGNCFQTEADASRYRDIDVIIHRIVFEKNQEEALDWKNETQKKWYLCYDYTEDTTFINNTNQYKRHKTPHCSQPFLDDVLKEISREDLDWYMVRG